MERPTKFALDLAMVVFGLGLLLFPMAPTQAMQNPGQPKPESAPGGCCVDSVTFHLTGAKYEVVGDYAGVAVSVTNGWISSLGLVVYATLKSGASTYVAAGTVTIAANATASVFCVDLQFVPAGAYAVTFAAVTLSDNAVSAPTAPISLVTSAEWSGEVGIYANSNSGNQFRLSISSDQVYVGDTITVNVSEFNTNNVANNDTRADHWQIPAALNSCPSTNILPFGIAVYKGYYTAGNVSQGIQVQIFPQVVCPTEATAVTGYLILPNSDTAFVLPGFSSTAMAASVDIVNGTSIGMGQSLPLNPGFYTVVAADEWGTLAFLYFQINGLP